MVFSFNHPLIIFSLALKKILSYHVTVCHDYLLIKNPLEGEFLSQSVWPFTDKSFHVFCQNFPQEPQPDICKMSTLKHNRAKINVNFVQVIYIKLLICVYTNIHICVYYNFHHFIPGEVEYFIPLVNILLFFLALNIISLVDFFFFLTGC